MTQTKYRTDTCGDLRMVDEGRDVVLAGWVQRVRKMGGMTFVDLRDRYGITQLVFSEDSDSSLCAEANKLGREYVVQAEGKVMKRSNPNKHIPTGEIEIDVKKLTVLNESEVPPFTIEDETDGGDDLRMKYRYLDLRRTVVRKNLELRHKMTMEVRRYLDNLGFLEVETPMLIGSTPEGARDFVVPSRMNPGQFYALPQSPQTPSNVSAMRTCVPTASLSLPRLTAKCRMSDRKTYLPYSRAWRNICSRRFAALKFPGLSPA